jgi:hypothetical protein
MLRYHGEDSFGRNEPNSGGQGCCVVAGYLTDATIWKQVSDAWRLVLDGPPKIEYFRMREYVNLCNGKHEEAGQFRGMSRVDADDKFDALVSILEAFGKDLGCIESTTTWDMFNYATTEEWRKIFKSPYSLCLIGILKGCRDLMDRIGGFAPVDFTFDEQSGLDLLFHELWKPLKATVSPEYTKLMYKIGFADDRQLIPIQCADLLAWHVRRQYVRPAEDHGKPRRTTRD